MVPNFDNITGSVIIRSTDEKNAKSFRSSIKQRRRKNATTRKLDKAMVNKFKPYTKNVIFFDAEFTSSNPYTGEIISLAVVKLSGEELYLELEYDSPVSEWVKDKILPDLKNKKFSRADAISIIKEFVGESKPYLISHYTPYDFVFINKLFKTNKPEQSPFDWVAIDIMSIFFGMGIDPKIMMPKLQSNPFYKNIGIDVSKYRIHNALDDAKLLREVYLKMSAL